MSYVPAVELEALSQEQAPPEQTPPPAAPPPEPAPAAAAPPSGYVPAVETSAQAAPQHVPAPAGSPSPSPGLGGVADYSEPAQGPFERAVRGAGEALGGAVAPLVDQAPEPAQNLANIVGQPAGGLVDAATNVSGALGQGDVPGAAMAALQPAVEPWRKGIEVVGERVIEGQSPVASPEEILADPTQAMSVLPGLASTYGPAPAISGTPLDVWTQQNPDAAQEAYAQGGGEGLREAWLSSIGASDVPPPQLSNPLDAATSGNPVERALQVAGAIPDFAGGWIESGKQGTLPPFLLGQAQALVEDPLILLPPAASERLIGGAVRGAGRGARRIPGVGGVIDRATALAPDEAARLAQEQSTTAAGEYVTARGQQLSDPLSAEPLAADVPPPNLGAAVPPAAVSDVPSPPSVPPPFVSDYAGKPWYERPVAYTPEGPIFREDLPANQPRNVPPRDPPPTRPPVRNMTDGEIARGQRATPEPTTPPSREAIGLSGSRWIDDQGHALVERPGTPQARIRPRERPRVESVYRRMFDAPPEQFYAPYQARFFDKNVPVSDQGLLSRYRGAMTQGLFMLDDWPSQRVARQLPAAAGPGGVIDWSAVERLSASGNEQARTTARKALAGKRAYDLYVHRVTTAPDPDLEVRRLLLTYHLDQVSGRFDAPQYTNTSYWRDRAQAIGEIIRDAGYLPSPEALAALRAMNLADEARTAFPDIPPSRLAVFEGQSPFLAGRLGTDLAVRTPQGQTIPVLGVTPDAPDILAELADEAPPTVTPETVNRPADVITAETRPQLEAALRRRLDEYGLADVGLRLVDRLSEVVRDAPDDALGAFNAYERIITIARGESPDLPLPVGQRTRLVLDHEVTHALRTLDLFDEGEWAALVETARRHRIADLITDDPVGFEAWNKTLFEDEMVAYLYESWRIGKLKLDGAATTLLGKIVDFFRGLAQALRDTYPESILRDIESGEVGRRPRSAPRQGEDRFALHARRAQQQRAVRAAYGAAPEEVQRAVDGQSALSRYGVATSEQAAKDLATPAEGRFRFADGWEPGAGLTAEDVINQVAIDVDSWADPASLSTWQGGQRGGAAEGRMTTAWKTLDKRFNPDGDLDAADFAGADRVATRDALAVRIFDEAQDRIQPSGNLQPKTKLGSINAQYLSTLRTLQLFNVGNVGRYFLQNLLGNTINISTRGGGARVALDMFFHPSRMSQVFRNQKSGYTTLYGAMEAKMGLGHKPNIPQSHKAYLDRIGGKPPKGLDLLTRAFAPETARYFGTIPDQLGRENVGFHAIQRGYKKLNQEAPGMLMELSRKYKLGIPDAKIRRVWNDFLDQNRTLADPNTGKPYRGFLGRPARFEPVWEGHEARKYLREHLAEDMIRKPDPQMLNNAVDRFFRTTQTRRREIADGAEALVDHALFSWRNTNADQLLSRATLYHYWMSRQGGMYVSEGLKRPWVFAAYGRMMDEMEQQAAELDQPAWLRGFFQMQNSAAGFSMWWSPLDLFQSLLTFADWQYGEDAADQVYKDLTALGRGASQIPYFVHPLITYGAYVTGSLGPDFYSPSLTGLETFGAKAIDILNLANAEGKLPEWVNAAGIGVDAEGNKVPIPVRPLQELYARVGNAISTALEPITGLTPVEVANMAGSQERNIASIAEQETRLAHPDWDQMRVNRFVTEKLADAGSDEYQDWFRKAAGMPFMGMEQLPGPLQGLSRLVSPVRVYTWPEQYNLDRWEGLQPSGNLPPRNLPADPDVAVDIFNEAKYGTTTTVEGRRLTEMNNDYKQLVPQALSDARYHASKGYLLGVSEPITVGGVSYDPATIQGLSGGDLYDLGTQILADAGYTREDVDASYDAQARYLADHPDLAQFHTYRDAINAHPGGAEGFVMETAAVNPGFAQHVRSRMMNHATGEIDYDGAYYVDAYLAGQGVRPSVYSPLVGNEPSTTPGGYPALAGIPQGQPLLPQVSGAQDIQVYAAPADAKGGYYAQPAIATLGAGVPMQVIDATPRDGMVQVSLGNVGGQPMIGYVDAGLLQSNAPAESTSASAPNPVQPQGGLAGLAGNAVGALGAAVQGVAEFAGNAVRGPSDAPVKPVTAPSYVEPPAGIDTTTYVSPNRHERPGPPEAIVYHYTVGELDSFIGEFMGATNRASSNYVVDRDGTIYQLVDPDDAAWTHGDTNNPRTDLPWLAEQINAGANINDRGIGIEIVNSGDLNGEFEPYSEEQIAALEYLTAYLTQRYGIPASRDHLLGHSDINTIDKRDPGPLFPWDRILAAA